jgi:hypothetical protein
LQPAIDNPSASFPARAIMKIIGKFTAGAHDATAALEKAGDGQAPPRSI